MRRRLAVVASTLLVGLTSAVLAGAPAGGQVPAAQADYKGFATGSVVHADAIRAGATGPVLLNTELAFSGASVASQGTGGVTFGPNAGPGTIVNEVDQVVQPAGGFHSFGRGSGLELGVGNTLPAADNAVILAQRAQAAAPPSTDLITEQVGPVALNPLAYAALLRGQAQARWNEDRSCVLGDPLSYGLGYAADAQLVNAGAANPDGSFAAPVVAADAPGPERAVSQSTSITRLVPQTGVGNERLGNNFGLMTETRMTIAPVSLFRGSATPLTIEFLGEWVLRAVATGVGGAAGNYVFYGPGSVSPETPVLRLIQGTNITQVTTQQILGAGGLPIVIPGLAEIVVGEDPRAIGGDHTTAPTLAGDGTAAAAAVDVVRIRLLETVDQSVADLRIGHMEVSAQVPPGGIACGLPVAKSADRQTVNPGDQFTYTITVTNPFSDCELTDVRVVDTISAERGVRFAIVSTAPPADQTTADTMVWNNIGPIGPKASKSVSALIRVDPRSAAGVLINNARATGNCATGTAQGGARVVVPLLGDITVRVPSVAGPPAAAELPATGANLPMFAVAGLGLLAGAVGIRRLVLTR